MSHLLKPLNILASFYAFKNLDMEKVVEGYTIKGQRPNMFADSGAYTAWTQGVEISIDEYAAWLHEWKHVLSVYANLDVIEDPTASEKNQRAFESMGLNPLPVWHIRSDQKEFHKLCEEYSYIGIGGMVGTPWQRLMPTLISVVKHATSKNVALHGLGLTSYHPVSQLPLYSVDSSSWLSGVRFGFVPVWDDNKKRLSNIKLGKADQWIQHRHAVTAMGFNPSRFSTRKATHLEMALCGAKSFQLMEQATKRKLGAINLDTSKGKPDCDGTPGIKIYLVTEGAPGFVGKVIKNYNDDHSCEDAGCTATTDKNKTAKCENPQTKPSYYRK